MVVPCLWASRVASTRVFTTLVTSALVPGGHCWPVVDLLGEPPFYALVERGGARINRRHVDAPRRYRPQGDAEVLTANIPVQGIEALHGELHAGSVDFAPTLKEQSWAARNVLVRDPDGKPVVLRERRGSRRVG